MSNPPPPPATRTASPVRTSSRSRRRPTTRPRRRRSPSRRQTIAAAGPSNLKIFAAEAIGTGVLMIVGPGTAILASDAMGTLGVALAFGLALLAMAYTIGHVSGCHINPAVTLSFFLTRKITLVQAGYYWVAQVVGALLGGLLLFIISDAGDLDKTGELRLQRLGRQARRPVRDLPGDRRRDLLHRRCSSSSCCRRRRRATPSASVASPPASRSA